MRAELDVYAESSCFVDEDAVVVCAVDVEVWCGVPVFAVGERVLNAEDAPVFVGAEDEIVGSDGEGFDSGEDAELAENFGRVRRDLNSGSHLGGVSER